MSDTSIHGAGSATRRDAIAGGWRQYRNKIAAATTSPRHAGDRPGAPRGGWLVNRVLCAVMGHRRLLATAAAEKLLPSGARRELFMCHACGSYAWEAASRSYSSSWNDVAV